MPSGRYGLEDWLRVTEFPAVAIKTLQNDRISFVFFIFRRCLRFITDILVIFYAMSHTSELLKYRTIGARVVDLLFRLSLN